MKISIFIFFILLTNTFSIVPLWDLKQASKNLLTSTSVGTSHWYKIDERPMDDLTAKLEKTIKRLEGGVIEQKNTITLNGVNKGTVNFEFFESYYIWKNNYILCPHGNYNPYKESGGSFVEIKYNDNWLKNDDTDLKCYLHRTGNSHLLVYYLRNEGNYFLEFSDLSLTENTKLRFDFDEIYDFKLVNRDINENDVKSYKFMAIFKKDGYIKLMGAI